MKKTGKYLAIMLTLVIISSVMISGTFAKYTSEFSGSDTALVARWDLGAKVGTTELDGTGNVTVDIFNHALKNVTGPQGVGNGDYILAPGVSGNFLVEIAYDSDVAAEVLVKVAAPEGVTNPSIAMEFVVTDSTATPGSWPTTPVTVDGLSKLVSDQLITSATSSKAKPGTIDTNAIEFKETTTTATEAKAYVHWRWAFERGADAALVANDAEDTGFGIASAADPRTAYELEVRVTGTQIKPTT